MSDRRHNWRELLWTLAPALGVVVLFLIDVLDGSMLVARDTTNLLYVIRRWHADTILSQGSIPLWNEFLFSGLAHLGNPQNGLFSPLGWLYFLFDGYLAHQIYIITMLCLGAVGMAIWVNVAVDDRRLAALWGLAYVLCGVVLSYLQNLVFATKGNMKEACRISGLSPSVFYERLKKHNIRRTS